MTLQIALAQLWAAHTRVPTENAALRSALAAAQETIRQPQEALTRRSARGRSRIVTNYRTSAILATPCVTAAQRAGRLRECSHGQEDADGRGAYPGRRALGARAGPGGGDTGLVCLARARVDLRVSQCERHLHGAQGTRGQSAGRLVLESLPQAAWHTLVRLSRPVRRLDPRPLARGGPAAGPCCWWGGAGRRGRRPGRAGAAPCPGRPPARHQAPRAARAPAVRGPAPPDRASAAGGGAPAHPLAAPAGFGKTTLLVAWLHEARVSSAWVSLDSGDDDPARFWSYTLAALDGVPREGMAVDGGLGLGLGAIGLPLLRSPQPPPLEIILTEVLNRLAALPADVVLVFDDYHVITAQPIHTSLTFLLDHLPERLHLVLATRADPPLPLARLRARGQLVELRATDLRFSSAEAAAFLAQSSAAALSPAEIAALEARTEGWIAGLQLAAHALHGRPQSAPFVQTFSGTHHFVVDYLTQEVLTRRRDDVQCFLLQTAILERLCAPLCEAVTGAPAGQGQALLERLEEANLFVVPLDEERHWYRYHHLFAEMLRQRLQRLHPERVAALHQRASAWYAQQGLIRDTVHHALAAADFAQAAGLIEQTADLLAKRGEIATLRAWLETLPADWSGRGSS